MAPSFEVGNPQRSLVRIPGSGSEKSLKPVCLEIAQITNFAQTDVIPNSQRPPPDLPPGNGTRPLDASSVRYQTMITHPPINRQELSRKRALEHGSVSISKKINPTYEQDKKIATAEDREKTINCLMKEKANLEEENHELKKKIMMFKDILRDPTKRDQFLVAIDKLTSNEHQTSEPQIRASA